MDSAAKEGRLYVQQGHKFGAKRWKKNWVVLYPASQHGVARLEFFDCKDPGAPAEKLSTKRLDKKILRLADCVSVVPVPESGPKGSTAVSAWRPATEATCSLRRRSRALSGWRSCVRLPFSGNSTNGARAGGSKECDGGAPALEMAVNSIYYSREEVNDFWVTVQRTEAAERCVLHGAYLLKAEQDSLILKEPRTQETLYTWPYRLLRRYGRDKVMFSFEAGRRCESGPGNFTFETKQGNEIFRLVEASIREQKAQVEENRQSCDSLDLDCPSVVLIRNALADSLSLELPAEGDGPMVPKAGLATKLSAAPEERDTIALLKARTLPEPPKPAHPSTSPRSPLPKVPRAVPPSEDPASLYSEPMDAVKGIWARLDPLYSDPIDSKPGGGAMCHGPAQEEVKLRKPGSLYSGLYDQVQPAGNSQAERLLRCKEHIYDEPEGRAPHPVPANASIYDEARPTSEAWRTQGIEDKSGNEYPYNPRTDDYSVPAFQHKAGPKGPKPIPAPKPQAVFIPKGTERSPEPSKWHVNLAPDKAGVRSGFNINNNNNEVLYSQVLKPLRAPGQELSVDENALMPIYEDLGEI
ncbi:docking protein 1 [Dermochelys coriacea]|uniref:docking protein 1 n=1 Tax=Dermochelys coriacea TaxID=27794 RepID=UPI0018E7EA08|nr:docking protein 1 [Dermochelys coriacea]